MVDKPNLSHILEQCNGVCSRSHIDPKCPKHGSVHDSPGKIFIFVTFVKGQSFPQVNWAISHTQEEGWDGVRQHIPDNVEAIYVCGEDQLEEFTP